MSYMDFLSGLVSEEVRHKEQRAVQSRIKSAKFPVLKSLDDFDYAFQPSINRKKLAELSSLRFIDNKENILFLGPPGIGKTHLSTGLGVRACESGYKVLFTTFLAKRKPEHKTERHGICSHGIYGRQQLSI